MKKPLLLIASTLLILISSSLSAQCLKIVRDSSTYSDGVTTGGTTVRDYYYDTNGRIAKLAARISGGSFVFQYDTAYYMSGKLDSIVSFQFATSNFVKDEIIKNTWSGNLLIKQIKLAVDGSYSDTTTYTYSGSTPNSLTSFLKINWEGAMRSTMALTNISFTNNNLTGGNFSDDGAPAIPVTATYDSYPNPFSGWAGEDDFLTYFSQNNNLEAYPTASPGTPFNSRTYTYSNGVMVSSFETFTSGESIRRAFVYDCSVAGILNSSAPAALSSYPNPSSDGKFHVESGNLTINEIIVISPTGEIVSNVPVSLTSSGVEIDLSNEAKGLYLVQLRGEKNIMSAKLIKH